MKSYDLNTSKINMSTRGYFRSIWTAVYQFWAHVIWEPKLGKPGEKNPCKQILCKYFSFLAYQESVPLLYETLDTLIEALTAFTVRQF